MEIFKTLIGNDEIKKTLGASIAGSSFSHAYIIEGAPGTGKKTIAYLAAAAILCENKLSRPCGFCHSCRKVMDKLHTDVRYYEISKVDQIRDIKQGLYDMPNESDYKIYILDTQKMNIKAQNALLISLEEPPKNVIFFLLTTDAGALLETIRSRAQTLRTELLDSEIIFRHLKSHTTIDMSDERLEQIVIASGGSLGHALDLMDEKRSEALLESRKNALSLTMATLKNDADAVAFLMNLSSTPREDLKELLSLSVTVIGDLMLLKKDKSAPLRFFTLRNEAIEISVRHSLSKLIACYEAMLTAISDLNMNSNSALAMMSILVNSKKKGN